MSSNDQGDASEEAKPPRMLESMGWLTESLLVPRKGKAIEGVGAGTLVDLKAQYYLGQEQARLEKESGEPCKGRKRKKDEDGLGATGNKGVLERDQKDRLHLKSKEDVEQESYAQLEKKAELYDQLAKGEGDEETAELYEVDFLEKRYEEHLKKSKTSPEVPGVDGIVEEDEDRKQRRELVLEQAGLTKKGRERAAQIKEARILLQKRKREQLKAAFIQKQLAKMKSKKEESEELETASTQRSTN